MKKTSLYTLAIICCLCLYSTTSKECGKIIADKVSADAIDKKVNIEQTLQGKEEGKEIEKEFSLIQTLFFQTT